MRAPLTHIIGHIAVDGHFFVTNGWPSPNKFTHPGVPKWFELEEVCVCLCVCVRVCVSLCLCVCVCVSLSLSLFLKLPLSLCLSLSLSLSLSLCIYAIYLRAGRPFSTCGGVGESEGAESRVEGVRGEVGGYGARPTQSMIYDHLLVNRFEQKYSTYRSGQIFEI